MQCQSIGILSPIVSWIWARRIPRNSRRRTVGVFPPHQAGRPLGPAHGLARGRLASRPRVFPARFIGQTRLGPGVKSGSRPVETMGKSFTEHLEYPLAERRTMPHGDRGVNFRSRKLGNKFPVEDECYVLGRCFGIDSQFAVLGRSSLALGAEVAA